MHVLVTGAAGFIGSHVCEALIGAGHRVTGIDCFADLPYPAADKRAAGAEVAARGVRLVEGDICDPSAVASVLDDSVDVVLHLAALAGVRSSLAEPLRYVRTNVEGTAVIAERMRALGKHRLVFASSSSVYGAKNIGEHGAFTEDDPCVTPASPYAATKRMNELYLSTYRDLFGLGVIALRFFTVYGPRQRSDMAIASFTRSIAAGTPIRMFGDGSSRRDYTYIADIVAGVTAAVDRVAPGMFEIVNLGGTRTVSLADLIATIERTVGRAAVIERLPDQPGDVPLTYANIDKARRLLGYEPATTPAEGIPRYWSWLQSRLS